MSDCQDWKVVVWNKPRAAGAATAPTPARSYETAHAHRVESEDRDVAQEQRKQKALGQLILKARLAKQLRQEDVARMMAVPVAYVRGWEQGVERYNPRMWQKFQKALGVRQADAEF